MNPRRNHITIMAGSPGDGRYDTIVLQEHDGGLLPSVHGYSPTTDWHCIGWWYKPLDEFDANEWLGLTPGQAVTLCIKHRQETAYADVCTDCKRRPECTDEMDDLDEKGLDGFGAPALCPMRRNRHIACAPPELLVGPGTSN